LICTEVFLWLAHQNLDYPEKCWCNVRNWGGIAPIAPPLATRLVAGRTQSKSYVEREKVPSKLDQSLNGRPAKSSLLIDLKSNVAKMPV